MMKVTIRIPLSFTYTYMTISFSDLIPTCDPVIEVNHPFSTSAFSSHFNYANINAYKYEPLLRKSRIVVSLRLLCIVYHTDKSCSIIELIFLKKSNKSKKLCLMKRQDSAAILIQNAEKRQWDHRLAE